MAPQDHLSAKGWHLWIGTLHRPCSHRPCDPTGVSYDGGVAGAWSDNEGMVSVELTIQLTIHCQKIGGYGPNSPAEDISLPAAYWIHRRMAGGLPAEGWICC